MRTRKIVAHVDAMVRQGRHILRLECGHNVSFFPDPLGVPGAPPHDTFPCCKLVAVGTYDCLNCADPPPQDPRRTKTAQQLYKESYEPDLSGL